MASLKRWVQVGQGEFFKWTEPNQAIEGVWQGQTDGQYGPLGLVDADTGGRVSFPLHTALLQRVENIKKGAEIRIVYTGKQQTKDGKRTFKAFDVFVANPEKDLVEPAEAEGQSEEVPF